MFAEIFLPSYTLWQREVVRFYRQRSRVIGAIVPPILFWFLIGSGLGGSFRTFSAGSVGPAAAPEGLNYLQYFYPGTIVMIVLFTAIFSTISIIEDRKEGFLQSVMVAPVSRISIVLGKIMGGTTIAFIQSLLFVLVAPVLGITFNLVSLVYIMGMLFLVSFGLTGLGFLIAWQMDSTQGFHSIMNLFLMPMWFLSGALFPMDSAPKWLKWIMVIDPLSYSVSALRYGLYFPNLGAVHQFPSPQFCLWSTILFCIITFILSVFVCGRQRAVE